MGKKRRNYPNLEELINRPWCYYCERDFEDLKLLISHQKAKHFKCDRCGRRLNTAGGLSVHLNQVHKETLSLVENAIDGRQGLDVEIFGMEGIPEEALHRHQQQILLNFQKGRADHQAATGNPPPGAPGSQRPAKKIKMETPEEIKRRLAEYRAQAGSRKAAAAATAATAQTKGMYQPPPGVVGATGLPQRLMAPSHDVIMSGVAGTGSASTLDDLVSGAAYSGGGGGGDGDDIDKMIRMAEAGIRPGPPAAEAPVEKATEKSKKEKSMRMVYGDSDYSIEEKMARMPRFAVTV